MVSMYYSDDLRATVIFQESVAGLGLPGWLAGSTGVREEGDHGLLAHRGGLRLCSRKPVANQLQTTVSNLLDDCFCRDCHAKVS